VNRDDFEALLTRRDELQRKHQRACAILEEEPHPLNHQKCTRLYDELAKLQQQIDDELATEQGRDG
jgi:hypothetical protein